MKWSWRIGRIAGIDVYMHFTFLFLLLYFGLVHYQQEGKLTHALIGVFFILVIFGIIVLHELGHALAARRYGIRTRDITLLPIGGVARLERMPEDPKQELVVALAGPAVNVVLAGVFSILLVLLGGIGSMEDIGKVGAVNLFVAQLVAINVFLVLFNMIPAFPMDGGRVLRAILAMRMDYVQATQTAASVGQGFALLFVVAGLLTHNVFLLFIALFVWIGAAGEASMVSLKAALAGIPVRAAMITDYQTLGAADSLSTAVGHIIAGFQQDFPVVDDGKIVGILTRGDMLKGLSQKGQDAPVADIMQKQFETADPGEMLEGAFNRLQNCECQTLPVVKNGQLQGMLTAENVAEFLMIRGALRERQQHQVDKV